MILLILLKELRIYLYSCRNLPRRNRPRVPCRRFLARLSIQSKGIGKFVDVLECACPLLGRHREKYCSTHARSPAGAMMRLRGMIGLRGLPSFAPLLRAAPQVKLASVPAVKLAAAAAGVACMTRVSLAICVGSPRDEFDAALSELLGDPDPQAKQPPSHTR